MLTIALSKGRILDDTLPLLAEAGIVPTENPDKSRKLIIPTTQADVRLLIVRATDVPTYVEHGAADAAVAAHVNDQRRGVRHLSHGVGDRGRRVRRKFNQARHFEVTDVPLQDVDTADRGPGRPHRQPAWACPNVTGVEPGVG